MLFLTRVSTPPLLRSVLSDPHLEVFVGLKMRLLDAANIDVFLM